uniref:Uncharacterized protein n=1 Tax=Ditylenchus dipsaci TaxID=166011 RepID=A0A915D3L2_9BILA
MLFRAPRRLIQQRNDGYCVAFPPFLFIVVYAFCVACLMCHQRTTNEGCIYHLPSHNEQVPPPPPAYPPPVYAQHPRLQPIRPIRSSSR